MSRADSIWLLEHEVGVLVRRVRRVVHARARDVHPDLQPAAYLVLAYLREYGAMRSSALAAAFDLDKGAVSRQVQHLVDLGLVERAADPEDGRAMLVAPSRDALRRMEQLRSNRRRLLDERLGAWSDGELAEFVAGLGRYNEALA